MSQYTHKVIFFSKINYAGDALIVMGNSTANVGNFLNIDEFFYHRNDGAILSFQQNGMTGDGGSYICPKGSWEFSEFKNFTEYTGGSYSGLVGPIQGWYPKSVKCRSVNSVEKGPENDITSARPDNYPLINYQVTFFPHRDAFIISPTPFFLFDKKDGFRWDLRDGDLFTFFWNKKDIVEDGAEAPALEFKPKSGAANRSSFMEDKFGNLLAAHAPINIGEPYKVKLAADGAQWSFDFVCSYMSQSGKKEFRVDPEMQLGTGTHN